MNLRERCTELRKIIYEYSAPADQQKFIEAFAREIRNEALEEAAKEAIRYTWREGAGCADAIRAIALIAAENET